MKRIFLTLLLSAALSAAAFAQQRFNVGIRAGVNISDYALPAISSPDATLRNARNRAGFEASLLARFNFTRHLNLQAEFEYDRNNYGFNCRKGYGNRRVTVNTNRIEIPLLLGLNLGPVRLFGGASFRLSHNEKSNAPSILQIKFSDRKAALTGGAGINIKHFFVEARITGYPGSAANTAIFYGTPVKVKPRHDLKWSLSTGFLF